MLSIISPVRIVLCFLALVIAGWIIIPQLQVDLLPKDTGSSLSISFTLPNSSPDIVEQQVTSIVEGACSRLSQVKKIYSVSNYNTGVVLLEFDRGADMQFKQFEVAAIIRQIYSKLPQATSYPLIAVSSKNIQQSPLLVYSINADLLPYRICEEAQQVFYKALAGLHGIKEVKVSGAGGLQLTIEFDKDKCMAWGIKPGEIIAGIEAFFRQSYSGNVTIPGGEQYFLRLGSSDADIETISNISIAGPQSKPILLKSLARVYVEEQEAENYFRINGKNSVTLNLYAQDGVNKIVVGENAKQIVDQAKQVLPDNFQVRLDHDGTKFLEKEISKNQQRAIMSICVLVVFIMAAYRSWFHLLNLLANLFITLSVTLLLAWMLKIEIHLFTIAGLAISFGIILDNAIVMLDHYQRWRDRKIFMALMAATLSTVVALSLVYLLPEDEKKNLVDFALIIVLALAVSLVTALTFVPGLYELTSKFSGLKKKDVQVAKKIAGRKKIKVFRAYFSSIRFLAAYRKSFLTLLILAFGIPIFLLPSEWEGSNWYHQWYNKSIGSEKYQKEIRPVTDKILGGALRLFYNEVFERSGYRDPEQTKLYVKGGLEFGNTADQLDHILSDFEKYLATVQGIDKFITNINSGQEGLIEISFKDGYDKSTLPFQLKSRLVSRSLDWDGVEWSIYGVGQGFSNEKDNDIPNFRVTMKGYNYDRLEKLSGILANELIQHKRIQKVNSNERLDYGEKQSEEYVLNLDATRMALLNTNKAELLEKVQLLSKPTASSTNITFNDHYYPVVLKEQRAQHYSGYDLLHHAIRIDSARAVRVNDFGSLELRTTANSIYKENRQYIRVVGFEYMGTPQFGDNYLREVLTDFRKDLPVGYTVEKQQHDWNWGKEKRRYALLFLLALAIFFLCGILFENLRQPFYIVSMLPVSFIGIFLVFSAGNIYFDQGGYASFIMLGGLVTNAAIFIVNDYNNNRYGNPVTAGNRILIKSTANRARTILLTTISTCCGLFPFLLQGENEVFWFPLASGTIAGLLTSLFALFVLLPVLLWRK